MERIQEEKEFLYNPKMLEGISGKILNNAYNNRILLFKYRQALATSSIIISLIFVLTNNFHKVRSKLHSF